MADQAEPVRPLALDDLAAGFAATLGAHPSGLVLAVSGGPDSTCLMRMTAQLAAWIVLPPVTVATVDHGLRPESGAEADAVMAAAAALGLPARRLVWTGPKPARALQEKARAARYALLAACCRDVGADHLATAHTRDDQAETVLFRLLRGSGPAGLRGMTAATTLAPGIRQVRPLLRVDKARLLAACAAHGWPYATDPSNADPRYARPRLRRLMPLLAREGLGTAALERLADRAARAEDAIAHAAEALAAEAAYDVAPGLIGLHMRRIARRPAEMTLRVIAQAAAALGPDRPIRLDRLERAGAALRSAALAGAALTLTLHGTVLRLSAEGHLTVESEARRRRGFGPVRTAERRVKHNSGPSLGNTGSDPYIAD